MDARYSDFVGVDVEVADCVVDELCMLESGEFRIASYEELPLLDLRRATLLRLGVGRLRKLSGSKALLVLL